MKSPAPADRFDRRAALAAWGSLAALAAAVAAGPLIGQDTNRTGPNDPDVTVSQWVLQEIPLHQPDADPLLSDEQEAADTKPEPEREEPADAPEEKVEREPEPDLLEPSIEPEHKPEPEPEKKEPEKASAESTASAPAAPEPEPPGLRADLLEELIALIKASRHYPIHARRAGITGQALLHVAITADGTIQNAEVASAERRELAAGASRTARRIAGHTLRSAPGRPLEVEVPLRFELR